jgi:hypothetical protein
MNKPSKTDNKRIKHWQRVSAAAQFPKSRSNPSVNGQVGTGTAFMKAVKQSLDSDDALPTSTKQAADQTESLRNWDNQGAAARADSRNPKP